MVLILDGSPEYDAHIWIEILNLICLRHGICILAQFFWLPSHLSTMVLILLSTLTGTKRLDKYLCIIYCHQYSSYSFTFQSIMYFYTKLSSVRIISANKH